MKTYVVSVREVHVQQIEVQAKSEGDAIEKVAHGEGTPLDDTLEFSHTLDTATWTVEQTD